MSIGPSSDESTDPHAPADGRSVSGPLMADGLPAGGRHAGGLSARAVIVALLLVIVVDAVALYADVIYDSVWMFGSGSPCIAGLVSLFLLTLVNTRFRRRGLTRRELLTIYCIVLVGGTLVTKGILGVMLPSVISLQYYSHARPAWETTFLHSIPAWFAPTDVQAVDGFFEGKASVPWSLWWGPLAVWLSFIVALFGCELSLVLLFRQQWIRNERLSFPMAQVPLEFVESGDRGPSGPGRVIRSAGFWIGAAAAFGLTFLDHLTWYVPWLPALPMYNQVAAPQKVGPMAALGPTYIILWPDLVAIAYLIPKEISFSCWVFWIVRVAMAAGAIAAGATPAPAENWSGSDFPAFPAQGVGALLALGVWAVWLARPHLVHLVRSAWRSPQAQDAGGGLLYRWILLALIVSFSYLVLFLWMAGARLVVALVITGLVVAYHMVWAKMRAETGIGFSSFYFPVMLDSLIQMPFGSGILRRPEILALYSARWAYRGGNQMFFEVVGSNAIEGLKIADSARIAARPLAVALIAGFVLSLVMGAWLMLAGMYSYGLINTSSASWLEGHFIAHGDAIYQLFTSTAKPDTSGMIAISAGAAAALVMGLLRSRFWWWPLHPIGYMLSNLQWGMNKHYLQFFIGWVAKTAVLRWGGLRLYRRTMPAAVGAIIGTQVNAAAWAVISLILRR